MSDADRLPATPWAVLKYRGAKFAEVSFEHEGEPCALAFRIPRESFRAPGMHRILSVGNLLKAVSREWADVESWSLGRSRQQGMDGTNPEFETVLAPPGKDVAYVEICVLLKPPPEPVADAVDEAPAAEDEVPAETPADAECPAPEQDGGEEGGAPEVSGSVAATDGEEPEIPLAAAQDYTSWPDGEVPEVSSALWDELESHWKTVMGLEANIEALRVSAESLMAEMECSFKQSLSPEEKLHAMRADVTQWTKEKRRVHDTLPKLKDVIRRSVWAMTSPERKRFAELYQSHIQPRVPFPRADELLRELEALQKDRHVLYTNSQTVCLESRTIQSGCQGALRTLQSNAIANMKKKQNAAKGGKFFKDVRKAAGL